MEKPTVIDENCFVIPPLSGPRDDGAFTGRPFISGLTPAPALGRLFEVDKPAKNSEAEPEGAD
jgi:hypothetical protein